MESFDLAKHLNTAPELVDRVYNRPTLETLETKSIQGAVEPRSVKVCVWNACWSDKFVVSGFCYEAGFVVYTGNIEVTLFFPHFIQFYNDGLLLTGMHHHA